MTSATTLPFQNSTQFHLVGIKGVAMTALTQCLLDLGKQVTGSDVEEDFVTKHLLDTFHVPVKIGFHANNISEQTNYVVYTGAHQGKENPEVIEAIKRGIPVLSHAEALGLLMHHKRGVAVCGVGGKTTTTAMLAWILELASQHPSYAIGVGNVANLQRTGAYHTESEWFIVEADEYATDPGHDNTPRFMHLNPEIIICTRVAYDHPDIYPSFEATQDAYLKFFAKLPQNGTLVIPEEVVHLFGERLTILQKEKGFSVLTFAQPDPAIDLKIPGEYNRMNAQAALLAAKHIKIPQEQVLAALAQFSGTMRRFEHLGSVGSIERYDDYAHHPDEITAVLRSLKEKYPKSTKIVLFQPHTYSRTLSLLNEFSQCFTDADQVYLLDIFASAREKENPGVSSDMLAELMKKQGKQAENLKTLPLAAEKLNATLKPGDVFITLGAGDVYHVHSMIK